LKIPRLGNQRKSALRLKKIAKIFGKGLTQGWLNQTSIIIKKSYTNGFCVARITGI
jgi:hypothetical protein